MLDSGNATEASPPARPWTGPVARAIHAEPRELKAVLLAFFYFFFLLSGYYILRPLRDEMGVAGGVKQLEWLFWATFGATLLAVRPSRPWRRGFRGTGSSRSRTASSRRTSS